MVCGIESGQFSPVEKQVEKEDVRQNILEEKVMAMGTSGGSALNSEINVTPMVDIMLVMLIIFMVITPLLQSGVNVIIPKGSNPDEEGDINSERAVVVSIPFAGAYYIGRDPVSKDDLTKKIETMMKLRRPDEPQAVYIRGGVGVPYGDVVDVINAIRGAGYEQVGLVADKLRPNEQ
jgi:biopolymer transport protein ExbD/biopolymer transport protein TolR